MVDLATVYLKKKAAINHTFLIIQKMVWKTRLKTFCKVFFKKIDFADVECFCSRRITLDKIPYITLFQNLKTNDINNF